MKRNLHRNSFLTYNILFHFSRSSGFYAGLELLNSITVCRQTIMYSFKRLGTLPNLYLFFKSSPYMFLTTNRNNISLLQKNPLLTPITLNLLNTNLLKSQGISSQSSETLSLINNLSFQGFLHQLLELYKLIVQLYLFKLFV